MIKTELILNEGSHRIVSVTTNASMIHSKPIWIHWWCPLANYFYLKKRRRFQKLEKMECICLTHFNVGKYNLTIRCRDGTDSTEKNCLIFHEDDCYFNRTRIYVCTIWYILPECKKVFFAFASNHQTHMKTHTTNKNYKKRRVLTWYRHPHSSIQYEYTVYGCTQGKSRKLMRLFSVDKTFRTWVIAKRNGMTCMRSI